MADIFIPGVPRSFARGTSASIYMYFDSRVDAPNLPPPELEIVASNRRNPKLPPTTVTLFRSDLIELQRETNADLEAQDWASDLMHFRKANGEPFFTNITQLRALARYALEFSLPTCIPVGAFTLIYRGFVVGKLVEIQQNIVIQEPEDHYTIPQSGQTPLLQMGRRSKTIDFDPVPRQVFSQWDKNQYGHLVINNRSGLVQRYAMRSYIGRNGKQGRIANYIDAKNRILTSYFFDRDLLTHKTLVFNLEDSPQTAGKPFPGSTVTYRTPGDRSFKVMGSRFPQKKLKLSHNPENTEPQGGEYTPGIVNDFNDRE